MAKQRQVSVILNSFVVIKTQHSFADNDRILLVIQRLFVVLCVVKNHRKIAVAIGCVLVHWTVHLMEDSQRFLQELVRNVKTALRQERFSSIQQVASVSALFCVRSWSRSAYLGVDMFHHREQIENVS